MLVKSRRWLSNKTAGKLAISGVLLSAGAALASHGAFATWTSAATGGPQSISTGTVTIALGSTGASTNRLTVNATGVAPGDTISRSVDLSNTGTMNLASITLGMTASPSTALDTDATNGLQLTVQSCSVSWTESGPPYTYTCGGTTATVLASASVAGLETTAATLSSLKSLTAGGTDHLVVTLTLPTSAPNSMQGLTSAISYTFTGSQLAAKSD